MKFHELNINKKLIDTAHKLGFKELTLIQKRCIPEILNNKDIIGQAETGSGKTIAFCLPTLTKIKSGNGIQILVLTPTRELCGQVADVYIDFGRQLNIKTTRIYGGVSIQQQIRNLKTCEVVIGTPGRILDHLRRKTIDFRNVQFLIIDETDKMFEMGFIDDVEEIIRYVPQKRQTLMFSATISDEITRVMNKHLKNPLIIKTQAYVDKSKLRQIYYDIYQQNNKFSLLVHLLNTNASGLSIVFCATRRESDIVAKNLRHQGIQASAIHGGMSQHRRLRSLHALKTSKTEVLVATDVAARGLDIKNITHIYHYDVPKTSTEYVHRIGRTARAGAKGHSITLLTEHDHDNFRRVQSNDDLLIKKAEFPKFRKLPFIRRFKQKNKSYRHRQ